MRYAGGFAVFHVCFSEVRARLTDKELAQAAVFGLKNLYPDTACALKYEGDPWRLLVMARLSAQCTDKRVNIVSETLFRVYPDVYAMAEAPVPEIEDIVRPCGLYHMKASDIRKMSEKLITDFGGAVPDDMESLLSLPGVGRKIANLIRGDVFGLPAVVTDTHCIRICGRLGFYPEALKEPHKIEKILAALIPPSEQSDFCHRLVDFGREICSARSPRCGECPLSGICAHFAAESTKK